MHTLLQMLDNDYLVQLECCNESESITHDLIESYGRQNRSSTEVYVY